MSPSIVLINLSKRCQQCIFFQNSFKVSAALQAYKRCCQNKMWVITSNNITQNKCVEIFILFKEKKRFKLMVVQLWHLSRTE